MWERQLEVFGQFGQVIAPDLPGFGTSGRQTDPSIPQMAAAVVQLLDELSVREPVFIGGVSMGGYVVFEFIRQFPKRVKAVGLFSTRSGEDTDSIREGRLKNAQRIRENGLGAFSKAMLPKLLGATTLNERPEVIQQVTEITLQNNPEGVADALLAMARRRDSTDLLDVLSRIPTLVVAGEEDPFVPKDETNQMHAQIAGAQLCYLPRAGHLVNLEAPVEFDQVVGQFLQKL